MLSSYTIILILSYHKIRCDASFHQYCYGIASLTYEDVFCDICQFHGLHNKKKNSSLSSKMKRQTASGNFIF